MGSERKKPAGRSRIKRIDEKRVCELAAKGVPQAQIAKIEGVNQSSICRVLAKYNVEKQDLADFKEGRADILDMLQMKGMEFVSKVLDSVSDDDVKALTAHQKMDAIRSTSMMAGLFYDKGRLERGQSTSNVQSLIVKVAKDVESLDKV